MLLFSSSLSLSHLCWEERKGNASWHCSGTENMPINIRGELKCWPSFSFSSLRTNEFTSITRIDLLLKSRNGSRRYTSEHLEKRRENPRANDLYLSSVLYELDRHFSIEGRRKWIWVTHVQSSSTKKPQRDPFDSNWIQWTETFVNHMGVEWKFSRSNR